MSHKPLYSINHVHPKKEKITSGSDFSFVFSDDVRDWQKKKANRKKQGNEKQD